MSAKTVLLYDGECGLCSRSVQFILKHDQKKQICFAALQSDYGQTALTRHAELRGIDSVILLQVAADGREQAFARSEAVLRLLDNFSLLWRLLKIAWLLPRRLRDWLYDRVASNRLRFFGRESCMLPTPEQRARFLDLKNAHN